MLFARFRSLARALDWPFFMATVLLAGLGLIVQYSLSFSRVGGEALFLRHVIFVVTGFGLMLIIMAIDFRVWEAWRWWVYGGGLLLLLAVLVIGLTQRGTRGWLGLAGFTFQTVEFMKPALAIILSGFWASRSLYASRWQDIFVSAILAGVPVGLVLWQPDFGSAAVLGAIWLVSVLLVGLRLRTFLWLVGVAVVVFILAWLFLFKPYQKDRVLTFVYPQRDPQGQGYQIQQSIVAVGSGKWFGRGFGFGPQSQQRFLPEVHTDFAFAALAEEFGFLGVTMLFGALGLWFYRLFLLARRLRDDFGVLLLMSLAGLMLIQVWVNIAMNVGWAPVVGIPFPFLSYGGSAMLASFIMAGLLESMFIRSR